MDARRKGGRGLDVIEWVGGRAVGVHGAEARWSLLADAERKLGWRAVTNRTSPPIGGDPLAIEGYRTIAFEIAEQLRWTAPDLVAVPAGAWGRHPGHLARLPRHGRWGTIDASRGWWRSRSAAPWQRRWPAARTGSRPAAT